MMFDMGMVGRKISELRKAQGMTQMELADRMNISFQAVSNWERGNSMPDISKLPELAQLFGVTIDALLGEKSELLEHVVNNNAVEYLQSNCITTDEFVQIAPLMKPEQADAVFRNVQPPFALSDIDALLPFLSGDVINDLFVKVAEAGNWDTLGEIAPFVQREVLDTVARKMALEGQSVGCIAPFIDRKVIADLAMISYEKNGMDAIVELLPFIQNEDLQSIAEREYASHGLREFCVIAPFLGRAYLSDLARKAIQKDGVKAISPIAPFLDKAMLSEVFREKYI